MEEMSDNVIENSIWRIEQLLMENKTQTKRFIYDLRGCEKNPLTGLKRVKE